MEDQLLTPLDNLDNNDQQNLVVQPKKGYPKEVNKIMCYYSIVIVIFSLKFVYYFFLWIICMVISGSNYDYEDHSYDINQKYFSLVSELLFPNLILSSIIMCVGLPPFYYRFK